MGIGKKQADKDWASLDTPARKYTDTELRDFHGKIQRFMQDHTLQDGSVMKILNWEEMAVAYGAFTKQVIGAATYYMAAGGPDADTKRHRELINLWDQYRSYRIRRDMALEHEKAAMSSMANVELSTV